MIYLKNRLQKQRPAKIVDENKLSAGTKLEIVSIIEEEVEFGGMLEVRDKLVLEDSEGTYYILNIRDYMSMNVINSGFLVEAEVDTNNVRFPKSITIIHSEDVRINGELLYPERSYNDFEKYLKGDGIMSRGDLIESGLKPHNTFDPIQSYTISTEF